MKQAIRIIVFCLLAGAGIGIALTMILGCAALRGQYEYTQPGTAPTVGIRAHRYMDPNAGGWTVHRWAEVNNPLERTTTVSLLCNVTQWTDEHALVIPAHTGQAVLLNGNDVMCIVRDWK